MAPCCAQRSVSHTVNGQTQPRESTMASDAKHHRPLRGMVRLGARRLLSASRRTANLPRRLNDRLVCLDVSQGNERTPPGGYGVEIAWWLLPSLLLLATTLKRKL